MGLMMSKMEVEVHIKVLVKAFKVRGNSYYAHNNFDKQGSLL